MVRKSQRIRVPCVDAAQDLAMASTVSAPSVIFEKRSSSIAALSAALRRNAHKSARMRSGIGCPAEIIEILLRLASPGFGNADGIGDSFSRNYGWGNRRHAPERATSSIGTCLIRTQESGLSAAKKALLLDSRSAAERLCGLVEVIAIGGTHGEGRLRGDPAPPSASKRFAE